MLLRQNMSNQKRQNIGRFPIRYKEFYIKATTNKLRIKYIEKISIKRDAKKMKDNQISKILIS